MAETHAHLKRQGHRDHEAKLARFARGGVSDEVSDKRMIKRGVHEHESNMHPGRKPTKLKLKTGGRVDGKKAKVRLDRPGRRKHRDMGGAAMTPAAQQVANMTPAQKQALVDNMAKQSNAMGGLSTAPAQTPMPQKRGGAAKFARGGHAKKPKAGNHVNVIVAGGGRDRPVPVPVPSGAPMGARPPMPPPRPPMGPAGPGAAMAPPTGMMAGMGAPRPVGVMKRGGAVKMDAGGGSGLGRLEKVEDYGRKKTGEDMASETEDFEGKSAGTGKERMRRGGKAA